MGDYNDGLTGIPGTQVGGGPPFRDVDLGNIKQEVAAEMATYNLLSEKEILALIPERLHRLWHRNQSLGNPIQIGVKGQWYCLFCSDRYQKGHRFDKETLFRRLEKCISWGVY